MLNECLSINFYLLLRLQKKIIVIFTFVYLTLKFETFTEILFHEIDYTRISGNFHGNLFLLLFMPRFTQLSQIFSYFL